MKPVRIGIIGVGGFGRSHLASIAKLGGRACVSAAVIRSAEKYRDEETALKQQGTAIFRDWESMLAQGRDTIDLIDIPGGIDQHRSQAVAALRAGYHVLCEKPVAGRWEDACAMQAARDASGKLLAIGFQDIYSPSIQRIKQLLCEGSIGAPIALKAMVMWPRTTTYYDRNAWAGKLSTAHGMIYDSPMQNGVAHFLNLMLYLAGDAPDTAMIPESLSGENYRAKSIESADTQFIRVHGTNGRKIEYWATHAAETTFDPLVEIQCSAGKVIWRFNGPATLLAADGTQLDAWDNDGKNINDLVFADVVDSINESRAPLCSIDTAMYHTWCIENLFRDSPVQVVPEQYCRDISVDVEHYAGLEPEKPGINTCIKGIDTDLPRLYREGLGFREAALPWAR